MINRNIQRISSIAGLIGLLTLIVPAERASAQLNDQQNFAGLPLNALFAVSPNTVPFWSLDGACSGGTIFADGTRGDNGTSCLRTLTPAGTGTRLVKDLNPGPGSSTFGSMAFAQLDSIVRMFLSVDDGSGTTGQELYSVQQPLYPILTLQSDINLGSAGSNPLGLISRASTNVYFSAEGASGREFYKALLGTNLTVSTPLVKDINPTGSSNPSGFTTAGSTTVFAADDGTNGRELWKTDGANGGAGTLLLVDINTTSAGASSDPQLFAALGSGATAKAFFTADNGTAGRELYRSDGTAAGTGMCKDIIAGPVGSNPTNLTPGLSTSTLFSVLFFTVDSDGVNGTELWKSGGALDGSDTLQIKDVGASPANLTPAGNLLFFTVGNDLWKSDATSAGTVPVQSFTSITGPLTALGGTVYFAANNGGGAGVELWKSDGTITSLVLDINSGPAGSSPANLTTASGQVYFSADDGTHGRELWRTDSTLGAVLIKDINPGSASSNPSNFNDFNGTVLFTADDGTHGTELWQTDGVPGGLPDHQGFSYKWDLSSLIQSKGDASKVAVAGTDANVFSAYWMHDFPALGGAAGLSDAAHQANFYVEITDGVDHAPLNMTSVSCGDGNLLRPSAALTDGVNHNAIAFGMVAVLDQNPCDTDALVPGSPGVPVAHAPAVYDGHDWIPLDIAHIAPGVPTNPPTATSFARGPWVQISLNSALPAGLVASPDDAWSTKRFTQARIDVWTDYIRVTWASKQTNFLYVATVPRQYKGAFKSLYIGNHACQQTPYPIYADTLNLNGGVFTTSVDPFGACCAPSGCSSVASAASCPVGVFTAWKACSEVLCCPSPRADADRDGDVDINDFAQFQRCYQGPAGGTVTGQCRCFDFVPGSGINQDDFNAFVPCKTGTGVPFNLLSPPVGCTP